MRFELKTCVVRSWRREDATALARNANDREIWRNLRDAFPHPYGEKDAIAWIDFASRARPETHFAVDVGGEAVGGIGFTIKDDIFRRSAEIGYWVGAGARGRGVAAEALGAVTAYAFQNFDLARVYATVVWANRASMRVLEKAGYRREARLRQAATKAGVTGDDVLYALTRDDWKAFNRGEAPRVSRVVQISVPVADLERATAFYRDRLKLPLVFEAPELAFFDCGDVRLMLSVPERAEFKRASSILYLAVSDLIEVHRQLKADGVAFESEPRRVAALPDHELWMAFFRDSEDNVLALTSERPIGAADASKA